MARPKGMPSLSQKDLRAAKTHQTIATANASAQSAIFKDFIAVNPNVARSCSRPGRPTRPPYAIPLPMYRAHESAEMYSRSPANPRSATCNPRLFTTATRQQPNSKQANTEIPLSLNRKQERLLEGFRDPAQEACGVGAIDQPVIVREGERQNQARLEFVVDPFRLHARTRQA